MNTPEQENAIRAFREGGGFLFPFRSGYGALGTLLDAMPPDEWRRDESVLGGLVLYLVKQGQAARAKSYLYEVNLTFEKTVVFDLLELLLALHLGEPVSDRKMTAWRRLERSLPIAEPLLLGLYYNAMLAMFVRLGDIEAARVAGQQAISCYREDGHFYLEHFIHIHLADLDVIEGRLYRAERGLAAARRCLTLADVSYGNEPEVIEIIDLAIAYERGDLDRVRREASRLRASLMSGDSWSELFFQLARIAVLSTYFLEGRHAAQDELAGYQADYARRHGGIATAVDVLSAWIWHLEWHPNEAERALQPAHSGQLHSAIGDVLFNELVGAIGPDDPVLAQTPRAAIVAQLSKAQRSRGNARKVAIEGAMKLAMDEGQIAPFLNYRDIFLGVSSRLAASPYARRNRKYAHFINRVFHLLEMSYVVPGRLRAIGFNRRQYRVASAALSGATNKQIAFQLGTSEATVKYHLTSLFRLTGTGKRRELIEMIEKMDVL